MPYKNPEEHYFTKVTVKLRTTEPIFFDAIQEASKDRNISIAEYLRISAREKLIRDGYMLESDK